MFNMVLKRTEIEPKRARKGLEMDRNQTETDQNGQSITIIVRLTHLFANWTLIPKILKFAFPIQIFLTVLAEILEISKI